MLYDAKLENKLLWGKLVELTIKGKKHLEKVKLKDQIGCIYSIFLMVNKNPWITKENVMQFD